MMGPRAEIKIF